MKVFYALLLSTLLASCGDDGYDSPPVSVTAQSGSTVELTGIWKSSCYTDGTDVIDVRIYSSNGRLTAYTETYSTSGGNCATWDSRTTYASDVRVTVGADKVIAGWSDGAGSESDTAPDDQTGTSTQLPDQPTVSKYSMTIDDGTTIKSIDLIDDSVSGSWAMYVADTNANDDADGYDDYLSTVHPLFLQ